MEREQCVVWTKLGFNIPVIFLEVTVRTIKTMAAQQSHSDHTQGALEADHRLAGLPLEDWCSQTILPYEY